MSRLLFDEPLSLYLHIPFCATKCTYCAFNTYTHLEHLIPAFVSALRQEIVHVGELSPHDKVQTIYFGGGTPSLLSPAQFKLLLESIHDHFNVTADCEITVEANPNDLNLTYLQALRETGVNRLSIGMQSANQAELILFDRRHDLEQVIKAVETARQAGFDNLGLDLIYGVPNQTIESWQESLRQIVRLAPDHLSLYALGLEEGTAMHAWVHRGALPQPDDDLAADMYEMATDWLDRSGYVQYEISNWSKPSRESRHNLQYWRNLPYVGLGPGAHGFAGGVRYATQLSPQRYIKLMHAAQPSSWAFPHTPVTVDAVTVSREDEISETLITGLRLLREGISRSRFKARFGDDVMVLYGDIIRHHIDAGLLMIHDDTIRVTPGGRLLTNLIFRDLV